MSHVHLESETLIMQARCQSRVKLRLSFIEFIIFFETKLR